MASATIELYHGSVAFIAGYELRGLLASSDLTETHRARGPGKKSVALKLLRGTHLPAEHALLLGQRFLSAGRLAASSSAVPGMATVLGAGDCETGPYIVTELLPGIDLVGLLGYSHRESRSTAGLPPSLVRAIGARVAQVLAATHASRTPLYHLSLSPRNVRITPTAQVKVLDFGQAAALRGLGHDAGRFAFMAPEVLRSKLPAVFEGTAAADLYSLGTLLFFLLTGRPIRQATSFAELVASSEAPLSAISDTPDDLASTVRRLLSPDPADRPSAAGAAEMLGGNATSSQHEEYLAGALRPLRIRWRSKKTLSAAVQRKTALVSRPARATRHWLLGLVGVVAGVGLCGWLATQGFHLGRDRKRINSPAATAGAGATVRPNRSAETDVPVRPSIDGGTMNVVADRVYVPMPKRPLPRVPSHLNLDTTPTGADIWVDGVLRGKTPVDLNLGPGGHRVVLLLDGHRMHKAVYDTTQGEWIRVELQPPAVRPSGDAHLNVTCRSGNRLPIFIDDEDVGRLCPAVQLRVSPGRHSVGVFVPLRRAVDETEVDVMTGPKPTVVVVKD